MSTNNARETPPPPSPSASEPPPSYNSLALGPSTSALLLSRIRQGGGQVFTEEEEEDTTATGGDGGGDGGDDDNNNNDNDGDSPPPYSPGTIPGISNGDVYQGNDAPPSYRSLFGQIQEAHRQSPNSFTFLNKLGHIILNTVGCTVLLMVFMSIPFTVLVLGVVYLRKCPLQPLIPIFLILGGISGVLKNISLVFESLVKRSSPSLSSRVKHPNRLVCTWKIVNLLFNLFMLIWIIAGSYWVYSIYNQVISMDYGTCNELLYKFSFAIVTLSYILLLLMCCLAGVCVWRNRGDDCCAHGRSGEGEDHAHDRGEGHIEEGHARGRSGDGHTHDRGEGHIEEGHARGRSGEDRTHDRGEEHIEEDHARGRSGDDHTHDRGEGHIEEDHARGRSGEGHTHDRGEGHIEEGHARGRSGEGHAHDRAAIIQEGDLEGGGGVLGGAGRGRVNVGGVNNGDTRDGVPGIILTRAHSGRGIAASEGVVTERQPHNGTSRSMEILTSRNHDDDGIYYRRFDRSPYPRRLATSQVMSGTDSGHFCSQDFRNAISNLPVQGRPLQALDNPHSTPSLQALDHSHSIPSLRALDHSRSIPSLQALDHPHSIQAMDHFHSIPSLNEPNSHNLHVCPRELYRLPYDGEEEMGGVSGQSSLYSTMHSDGYSITAV